MQQSDGSAGGELTPGRHDAVVVDARWSPGAAPARLEMSLTLISGDLKGEVVEVAFAGGSQALARALSSLGLDISEVHEGDDDIVTAGVLGMPCTLVLAHDSDGAIGYALDP